MAFRFVSAVVLSLLALTKGEFVTSRQALRLNFCIVCVGLTTRASSAACPPIPEDLSSFWSDSLPDPFTFADGSRVKSQTDWSCRQTETKELIQRNELGTLPGKPNKMSATLSSGTLNITVTEGANTISFTPTITLPANGTGPFPALIAFDGLSIPVPEGVAIITFVNDDLAQQIDTTSRGQGKFYDLFPNATTSSMLAWAWGVSRIIDALETMPSSKINTQRIGVTGCSRDGKGALVAGAFEERLVLTIPQESGSGGTDCWRLSDELLSTGLYTQTASEIVQENVWFATAFDAFANTSVNSLPFDHHNLAGLIAPRGLFVIDNIGYDWLGAWSSFGCMASAQKIWEALGASESMGYSQAANHSHCVFPATQQPELDAFINKFLLDLPDQNTSIAETAGAYTFRMPGIWNTWVDNIPKL